MDAVTRQIFWATLLLLVSLGHGALAEEAAPRLAEAYRNSVRPLLERYCHDCHNADLAEAEIDLAALADWEAVGARPQTWQRVAEMLDNQLMPPDGADQPTEEERIELRQWLRDYLTLEAKARAGDPGPVILRRLSNAEYAYTLRDLTAVATLDPAREFPVDGAAGEGFTNAGGALAMSPTLVTKYLDAAKEAANHAVLLPEGFRFSSHTSRSDHTNELVAEIRKFYQQFTTTDAGEEFNLQGVVFNSNEKARIPLEKYLAVTLRERDALAAGTRSVDAVAERHGLNAKYLGSLWKALNAAEPSLVLDQLRVRWRAAGPDEAPALAAEIAAWQRGLWQFASVGHIGKVGGPQRWMEPVNPVATEQEIRLSIPAPAVGERDVALSLVAGNAGDGSDNDVVVWSRPRLAATGRPDILLRDVRGVSQELAARRARMAAALPQHLAAVEEALGSEGAVDIPALASSHGLSEEDLQAWCDYLGIGAADTEITGRFTNRLVQVAGHDFVAGWGSDATPLLLANASDAEVRIPGRMRPRSVAIHPSVAERAAIGWRSPASTSIRIDAAVTHAHPECGNGVAWRLELRRGGRRQRLAVGTAQGPAEVKIGPIGGVVVAPGDVVALSIGPRDGEHSCDLAAVDLRISSEVDPNQSWDLAADVSSDVLAGNPHADRLGHADVWHFYTEPEQSAAETESIPAGSLLARWQLAPRGEEKARLVEELQRLLAGDHLPAADTPDGALYRQLTSYGGPLWRTPLELNSQPSPLNPAPVNATDLLSSAQTGDELHGLDPTLFGGDRAGQPIDPESICVQAPSVLTFRLPAALAEGYELVAVGALHPQEGAEGSVQLHAIAGASDDAAGLRPTEATVTLAAGKWSDDNRRIANSAPIVVAAGSAAEQRILAAFNDFRELFPAALCYTAIVPVDEVVTLTLYFREDDHLVRLMLDESQAQRLDQLWAELRYVSRDALTLVDVLEQLIQFATQDADPGVFEPLRQPFSERAAAFEQQLRDSEPSHVEALVAFAARAYRRPLATAEAEELRSLYRSFREEELPHEEAFRMTLARILVAPAFLYRIEEPAAGAESRPVTQHELATRLSYFLWSSQPDDELLQAASDGKLSDSAQLAAQVRRMLVDPKAQRLATEFACQWLHIRNFAEFDEKSERHFPTFADLRGAMAEESALFFADLFQNDGSILDVLDADYTFLNEALAEHYGIPGVVGPEWRRVDGVKQYARGGILGHATVLATQAGASRTSPILRGVWVSEALLGERLPRPPKGVPPLPDDEAGADGVSMRQVVERHVSDPRCAGCHRRIDPYGFSLEEFDAIGRHRTVDVGDRPIDASAKTMDGAEFAGLDGLREYLLNERRDAFVRQFCRKLLGFSLGRSVQLSDEPLLDEMLVRLEANDYRTSVAIDSIVNSKQFREVRGRDAAQ